MKHINLKTVKYRLPDEAQDRILDYHSQLLSIVSRPLQGATLEDIDKGCRVLGALNKAAPGATVALEDADHAHLCELLATMRFAFVHDAIAQFGRDVRAGQDGAKQKGM